MTYLFYLWLPFDRSPITHGRQAAEMPNPRNNRSASLASAPNRIAHTDALGRAQAREVLKIPALTCV